MSEAGYNKQQFSAVPPHRHTKRRRDISAEPPQSPASTSLNRVGNPRTPRCLVFSVLITFFLRCALSTGSTSGGAMKALSLPAILLLSCRDAGAFLGQQATLSGCIRRSTSRKNGHDDSLHTRCYASPVQARRGITRRRHPSRAPQVISMATGGGGDSGESAESADGGTEEEISTQEEDVAAIPGERSDEAKLTAGEVDVVEPAGDSDVDDATAAALGQGEGAEVGSEETEEQSAPKEEKQEEVEDDGETMYLPSGDNKDFRLFRAKLRAGSDEKWREQLKRNVNVAQLGGQDAWAHELNAPEKGCLIVAKSSAFSLTQTYFNEAVIFLASHDENGSAGFILNRPTSVCLGDLLEDDALPQFRGTPLYLGGDVGEGNVQILHPYGPDKLAGSMEIVPGVYISGAVDDADHMVANGEAKVDDFRFFLHLCGWAPGQLEAEIERGVWFPAATSTNVIMKHCLGLPVPMWREVMTLMGPKYGLLARDTYDDL